jgi:hypothetical protein
VVQFGPDYIEDGILEKASQFVETPNVIGDARFHRWRHSQGLVNPAEVIVHVMKRNRVLQVFQFLREAICQASKPAHGHAHRQVFGRPVAETRRRMTLSGSSFRLYSGRLAIQLR